MEIHSLYYCKICKHMTEHYYDNCLECSQQKATENNFATVDRQSDETRLAGELYGLLDDYADETYNYQSSGYKPIYLDKINEIQFKILAWHETEKQKYAMAYTNKIIGYNELTKDFCSDIHERFLRNKLRSNQRELNKSKVGKIK